MFFHISSVGEGINLAIRFYANILQGSRTILCTVLYPMRLMNEIVLSESPVATYLKGEDQTIVANTWIHNMIHRETSITNKY